MSFVRRYMVPGTGIVRHTHRLIPMRTHKAWFHSCHSCRLEWNLSPHNHKHLHIGSLSHWRVQLGGLIQALTHWLSLSHWRVQLGGLICVYTLTHTYYAASVLCLSVIVVSCVYIGWDCLLANIILWDPKHVIICLCVHMICRQTWDV